ncbi:hypothetical protein [Streptomyces sp. NRRL S-15]|uniref:hypothetical protein n=1 Tax=Streptomyces sp. NRRL S-15 TaxID=1463886 RepID=UPI00131BAC00|nr:hypothetical protein [Streptomyces sp. NRRL S-15]
MTFAVHDTDAARPCTGRHPYGIGAAPRGTTPAPQGTGAAPHGAERREAGTRPQWPLSLIHKTGAGDVTDAADSGLGHEGSTP